MTSTSTTYIQCSDGKISLTDKEVKRLQEIRFFKEVVQLEVGDTIDFAIRKEDLYAILNYILQRQDPILNIFNVYKILHYSELFQIKELINHCQGYIYNLFYTACENDDLSEAMRLYSDGYIHKNYYASVFWMSCHKGHLDIAQWLSYLKPDMYQLHNLDCEFIDITHVSCLTAQLEVSQWLDRTHSVLTSIERSNRIFTGCCKNKDGYLEILQWLWCCGTDVNIHAYMEFAFRTSCLYGHLDIVKWLWSIGCHTSAGKIDLLADDENAFLWACTCGHLQLAQWLYLRRAEEIEKLSRTVTIHSITGKSTEIIITAGPVFSDTIINLAFYQCCGERHRETNRENLAMIQWLDSIIEARGMMDITYHIRSRYNIGDAFYASCLCGKLDVAQWIYSHYGNEFDLSKNRILRSDESPLIVKQWIITL